MFKIPVKTWNNKQYLVRMAEILLCITARYNPEERDDELVEMGALKIIRSNRVTPTEEGYLSWSAWLGYTGDRVDQQTLARVRDILAEDERSKLKETQN